MNSEFQSADPSVRRSALEILCENLSDGLHASAQPLTILRASLGNPNLDQMTAEELLRLAHSSANQVARLCGLFDFLQKLVGAESTKPELLAMPMEPLIAHVVQEARPAFEKAGITLQSTAPADCAAVLIDGAMTLEALSNLLAITQAVSRPEDTVELVTTQDLPDAVQIVVRNQGANLKALKADMRLALAVAEAGFRAQRATMRWSPQPFTVQIEIPQAPEGSIDDEE